MGKHKSRKKVGERIHHKKSRAHHKSKKNIKNIKKNQSKRKYNKKQRSWRNKKLLKGGDYEGEEAVDVFVKVFVDVLNEYDDTLQKEDLTLRDWPGFNEREDKKKMKKKYCNHPVACEPNTVTDAMECTTIEPVLRGIRDTFQVTCDRPNDRQIGQLAQKIVLVYGQDGAMKAKKGNVLRRTITEVVRRELQNEMFDLKLENAKLNKKIDTLHLNVNQILKTIGSGK